MEESSQVIYYSSEDNSNNISLQNNYFNSHQAVHANTFRHVFQYFLMHFSLEEEFIYLNKIRQLNLCPWKNVFTGESSGAFKNRIIPSLRLDLEHLMMPHWLPKNHDAKTTQDLTTFLPNLFSGDDADMSQVSNEEHKTHGLFQTENTSSSWSELLIHSFHNFPLQTLKLAEEVIRTLYVEMLSPQDQQECLDYDKYNSIKTVSDQSKINEEKLKEKKNNILSLFQLELISRHRTLRIRDLTASHVEKLVVIPGIVVQAYKPQNKAIRIKIKCKQCDAEQGLSIPFWKERCDLPKYCSTGGTQSHTIDGLNQTSRCPIDPYIILSDESEYSDIQLVKLQELPEHVPTGDMPRHVLLNTANTLCGRVVPGQRLLIVGVYTTYYQKHVTEAALVQQHNNHGEAASTYIHVLGLDYLDQTELFRFNSKLSNCNFNGISSFLQEKQFQTLSRDPDIYKKIYASIAPSLYGLDDIKKSIACLLFGGSRKFLPDGTRLRGDINMLLLGDPSTAKSQFLKFVQKVAPIAVYTSGKGSSAAGLTAAVIRDANKNFALEGGAMVLADGGVVCIDEFDKMKDDDRVSIHEAMEQQTISIAKAGITTVLTTRCSVLAAANPAFGSYDDSKETTEQHDFETTILSRFDLIWLIRDVKNAQQDQSVAKHIVQLHLGHNAAAQPESVIPLDTLRNYIHYARTVCNPMLSNDAAKKLENYYVEIRNRMRQDNRKQRDQIPITIRQLESLSRIAESLARMSLSQFVTIHHIEEAIHLFNLATMEAAKSNYERENNVVDIHKIHSIETAILQRLPINGRASKSSIVRELQLKGFDHHYIIRALVALIHKGVLEERGDASVKRIAAIA